jgi:hypothetical protein
MTAEMDPSMEEIRGMTPDSEKDPTAVESARDARAKLDAKDPEIRKQRLAEIRAEIQRRKDEAEAQRLAEIEAAKTPAERAAERRERQIAERGLEPWTERVGKAPLRTALGVAEMGLMVATGAAAEVVGGWAGLLGGGSAEDRANRIEALTEAMTFTPKTLEGELMLQTIAKPLMWLDDNARDISEKLGGDSPIVQAGIYTTLTGGAEIIGFKGAGKLKVNPKLKEVQKVADDMGIGLKQSDMSQDVIDAARRMSPEVRAQNAGELREALLQARNQQRMVVAQQTQALRKTEASMRAGDVTAFAKDLGEWMTLEGYDIAKMPGVKNMLDDLGRIDKVSPLTGPRKAVVDAEKQAANAIGRAEEVGAGVIELPGSVKRNVADNAQDVAEQARRNVEETAANSAATLNEIQTIRNRAEKRAKRLKDEGAESFSDEAVGLATVQRKLDEFLDEQFMNDMIDGTDSALSGWRIATEARTHLNRRFNEDRVIKQLMDREASPEAIRAFVFGQSSVSPKGHAVKVVRKLKSILGKDHPAIQGMQADMIFELTAPLLSERPNFNKFIADYDKLTHRHPTLVKELGLGETNLKKLRDFATVANRLPTGHPMISIDFISKIIARQGWGHQIAKKGMQVNILSRMIAAAMGKDSVPTRKILAEALEVMYDEPAINKNSVNALRVAQATILADITDAGREDE